LLSFKQTIISSDSDMLFVSMTH